MALFHCQKHQNSRICPRNTDSLWLNMCSISGKVDQAKFDVMQLHARPELAARHRMVDDASGDVKVRVTPHPPHPHPSTDRGNSFLI